jgi:AraC family transcriptional regulator of adaptative response/methylated-DNA-[protein]-cysteine methyltransferase
MIGEHTDLKQMSVDYSIVEQALIYLEVNHSRQPTLEEVAESVGFSPYHFQRLFTRWVGISPKRFTQYLTKEHAKYLLENSRRLLDVAYSTGLSGPGRLHDLFVTCEAVTPGEFKSRGRGLVIEYGFYPTPFGECMIASTTRGICSLMFFDRSRRDEILLELKRSWKNAAVYEKQGEVEDLVVNLFRVSGNHSQKPLQILLNGTNFQIKVWEALLKIPAGRVVSYQDVASAVGEPGAYRAVGSALARNPVPLLIPCHRVIRKMGDFGEYQWGRTRKQAMLGWEMAKFAP